MLKINEQRSAENRRFLASIVELSTDPTMQSKNEPPMPSNDERLAVLETVILNINTTLIDIRQDNKRLEDSIRQDIRRLDEKIDRIDQKFDTKFDAMDRKFESRFERVENRLWSIFIWQLGAFGGLAVFIAHLHKLI
jgi:hypothetical protein